MGDSVTPGPVEVLVPFIIEESDLGPYVPGMALSLVGGGWSDDALRGFVFDGDPLPAPVPLDGSAIFLTLAMAALIAVRRT
jgi:hypothetical protein